MPRMHGYLCMLQIQHDEGTRQVGQQGEIKSNSTQHTIISRCIQRERCFKSEILFLCREDIDMLTTSLDVFSLTMCFQENISGKDGYLDKARVCHDRFELDRVDKRFSKGDIFDARVVKTVHVVPN